METKILLFLVILFFAVLINVGLMVGIYKMFAGMSVKVKDGVDELARSDARRWLESLQAATEQAVQITDSTKQRMADFEPEFARFHRQFQSTLTTIDSQVERITTGVSENATVVRDVVTDRAEKFGAAAAGVSNVLSFVYPLMEDLSSDS